MSPPGKLIYLPCDASTFLSRSAHRRSAVEELLVEVLAAALAAAAELVVIRLLRLTSRALGS